MRISLLVALTSVLCSQALCQGDDPLRSGLLAASHTKTGPALWTRHTQRNVHTFAHIAKLKTQDIPVDCRESDIFLRGGFGKAHPRSAPSGASPAKYGEYGWISHDP